MIDIVERLRIPMTMNGGGGERAAINSQRLKAADLIEAQAKRIAELTYELKSWKETSSYEIGRREKRIVELEALADKAPEIAHEICASRCWAYTGEGHEHSDECQHAANIIRHALLKDTPK